MTTGACLAVAPGGVKWVSYRDTGVEYAAPYLEGALVQHDLAGYFRAGSLGERMEITSDELERLNGTAPDGLPIWPPVAGLFGPPVAGAVVVRVADVSPESVEWQWPGRIPLGKLVMLDGDPGLGKSTLLLDLTARTTTGTPFPDGHRPLRPRGVLLLSAEDGVADTIRPRLEAAGADLERVIVMEAIREEDDQGATYETPVTLPADLPYIRSTILENDIALVVIDPLMAFLGGKIDAHKDQDVRRALHPMAKVAEATHAAFVLVRHLNKAGGSNALYRGGGSIGIVGAARAQLLVAPDPDDDSRRILAVGKSNLAPIPESLAFRLVSDELREVARVQWEGASHHKAGNLLTVPESEEDRSALDEACEFLADYLSDGPRPAKGTTAAAIDAGHARRTVDRAKKRLGIASVKQGADGWLWTLPAGKVANPEHGVLGDVGDLGNVANGILEGAFPGVKVANS